jgi:hypothetical protein
MFALSGLIRAKQDELAELVSLELGKTLEDARGSVFRGLEGRANIYSRSWVVRFF